MSNNDFTEKIRLAARGQWRSILTRLCGLNETQLDPKIQQPCPKCGGTDRFRALDDVDQTGAVLCNQCFREKNGDGFAAIQWLLGCTFPQAVEMVGSHLGMAKSKKIDPAKDLKFDDWNDTFAAFFLKAKPGITKEALQANGARMAMYKKKYRVIAFPIIGQDLNVEKPVGWVAVQYNGKELPVWDRKGNVVRRAKYKVLGGSKPGFVGTWAVGRMAMPGMVDTVIKCEGISDMLTCFLAIPEQLRDRIVPVTNANGAQENPKWFSTIYSNFNTAIIHDADHPGQAGAKKLGQDIVIEIGSDAGNDGEEGDGNDTGFEGKKWVKIPQLPFEIVESHGKDLRDLLLTGSDVGELALRWPKLEQLIAETDPLESPRNADGSIDYGKLGAPIHEQILKALQIEILYEEENGSIRIFSTFLRKSSTIRQVDRLREEALIQMAGNPAFQHVKSDADPDNNYFTISQVRKAIAFMASTRRGRSDEKGVGVWQGLDDFGNETNTIVLAGDTEAARWNGDKMLRKVMAPRVDGLVLDFGSNNGEEWFDFDKLTQYLQKAENDDVWVHNTLQESIDLFSQWNWRLPQDVTDVTRKGAVTDGLLAGVQNGEFSWSHFRERSGESSNVKLSLGHVDAALEEGAFKLLHDIVLHPNDGVDVRYKRLSVSADKGNRWKEQLFQNGLVRADRVKVERTYRVMLRLTGEARVLMVPQSGHDPQASFIHEYWKRRIAHQFEAQGYTVVLEAPRKHGGGNMDISATRGSENCAVEIETGKSNVVSNVKRDLLCGVSKVVVVATDEGALKKVERQLGKAGLLIARKVEVVLGGE